MIEKTDDNVAYRNSDRNPNLSERKLDLVDQEISEEKPKGKVCCKPQHFLTPKLVSLYQILDRHHAIFLCHIELMIICCNQVHVLIHLDICSRTNVFFLHRHVKNNVANESKRKSKVVEEDAPQPLVLWKSKWIFAGFGRPSCILGNDLVALLFTTPDEEKVEGQGG